jgi:4-diphosphocytidyl-2-C-methyl-D-erythritol kinase
VPTLKALAPAKLNLSFDITGLLPDGYHRVETLYQSVDLCDELTFVLEEQDCLSVSLSATGPQALEAFPLDESNLIARAARAFLSGRRSIKPFALAVTVDKRIPMGAGLAGGSSDAAATLAALNRMRDYPYRPGELHALAVGLGADVPFCLRGGTCAAGGRGEQLVPLEMLQELVFCIVCPREHAISTAWAYAQYDAYSGKISRPDLHRAATTLAAQDLPGAVSAFGNVFEPVIFAHLSELVGLKEQLLELGVLACHLSGSGPALWALVSGRQQADEVAQQVTDKGRNGGLAVDFFIAGSLDHGVSIVG